MAPGRSSGIVYDRGRRSNSMRRMKHSESLRSQSAVFERAVMPTLASTSTIIHTCGTLQTPEVNEPQALTAAEHAKPAQIVPAKLSVVGDPAIPVTDPAAPEVSGTIPSHVCLQLT